MKIFFEEYEYPLKQINEIFDSGLYSRSGGSNARLNAVGYYFSTKVNDSVFILPKVFLFEDKETPAFKRYNPYDIVDLEANKTALKENGDFKVIFDLSIWIYLAIRQYSKRHPNNKIAIDNLISNVKSAGDINSNTYLDIILSLRKFNKDHRNLLTLISIINKSGNNRIDWNKTVKTVQPIIQNNKPNYIEFKNKREAINFDEELIILFYSVLNYISQWFPTKVNINLNYDLIKPIRIKSMIETGKGTRILKKMRHKYFKDEFVALWNLLYTFFDKSEKIAAKNYIPETLLSRNFNIVFEDMIDVLLGDEKSSLPNGLMDQPDGKIVDHIYSDKSLLDENLIYYIGDSKYYKDKNRLKDNSIYKQFTYAKNVIQVNLNLFLNDNKWHDVNGIDLRYKDDLTEGYNVTPNFFIRGNVDPKDMDYNAPQIRPEVDSKGEPIIRKNYQFRNRLFDRDTLFTKEYNINFLYVLAAYAANADIKHFKKEAREIFRKHIIGLLNGEYNFYHLEFDAKEKLEGFVKDNFRELLGKLYYYDGKLILAIERNCSDKGKILHLVDKECDQVRRYKLS